MASAVWSACAPVPANMPTPPGGLSLRGPSWVAGMMASRRLKHCEHCPDCPRGKLRRKSASHVLVHFQSRSVASRAIQSHHLRRLRRGFRRETTEHPLMGRGGSVSCRRGMPSLGTLCTRRSWRALLGSGIRTARLVTRNRSLHLRR